MPEDKFFDLSDGVFVGKGISAFQNSEEGRAQLISLFGGVENIPSSIMKAKRARPNVELDKPAVERGYNATMPLITSGKLAKLPKRLQKGASSSGKGCAVGALSTFPQNICRSMVLLYSKPGDTVFDPFAGHASRIHACVTAGRNYIGCDLCHEFMDFNRELAEKLKQKHPKVHIELHECDSRKIPVPDNTGDFTISSPPYHRQEKYGDEPGQLYDCKTYEEFLHDLGLCLKENLRVLNPGAYCVWFVNDFRDKGKMRFYHADLIQLGKGVGFVPHDLLVVDFGPGIRDCFTNQLMQTKILPKRNEFGIVFKKPELPA